MSSCHIFDYSSIFANQIFYCNVLHKMEKTIDENVQGTTLAVEKKEANKRNLYIESYGCAMNFADSEIVASILATEGFNTTQTLEDADLILVNTCSIRDKAEQTIRKRLTEYNKVKILL